MTTFLTFIYEDYPDLPDSHLALSKTTSHTTDWRILDGRLPWSCAAVYLMSVLYLLPKMRKGKSPMNMSRTIVLYNTVQVVFALYMIIRYFCTEKLLGYIAEALFHPRIHRVLPNYEREIAELAWYYMASKYVQCLETIFFVLRGKQNQVTFLHVYHHANMVISTWIFIRFFRLLPLTIIIVLNEVEHFAMYFYYLTSSLGINLGWKKYITMIQMLQFVIMLVLLIIMIISRCPVEIGFVLYTAVNTISFLSLYITFYKRSYRRIANKKKDE